MGALSRASHRLSHVLKREESGTVRYDFYISGICSIPYDLDTHIRFFTRLVEASRRNNDCIPSNFEEGCGDLRGCIHENKQKIFP